MLAPTALHMEAGVVEHLRDPMINPMKKYHFISYWFLGAHILLLVNICSEAAAQYQGGAADGQGKTGLETTISLPLHCHGGQGEGHASLVESNSVSPGVYCLGGTADGNASLFSFVTISDPLYAFGGNGDGMTMTTAYSTIGVPIYCLGGNKNGFAMTDGFGLTSGTAVYCSGGNQDGSGLVAALGNTNGPAVYCHGGDADGGESFIAAGTISIPVYCFGGSNDGQARVEVPLFAIGQGLWNGYVNTSWNNAANWTNNCVPDESFSILIPGDCLNYPVINTNFSVDDLNWGEIGCKRLDINYGASITTLQAVRISGIVNIEGQFNHMNPDPLSFTITPGGSLSIKPGGSLLLQP